MSLVQTETKASSTAMKAERNALNLLFLPIFVWLAFQSVNIQSQLLTSLSKHLMQSCEFANSDAVRSIIVWQNETWVCLDLFHKEYHIIQKDRPKWSFYYKRKLQISFSVLKILNRWQVVIMQQPKRKFKKCVFFPGRVKLISSGGQVFVLFWLSLQFFFVHHGWLDIWEYGPLYTGSF